jgi:hypothetical protein
VTQFAKPKHGTQSHRFGIRVVSSGNRKRSSNTPKTGIAKLKGSFAKNLKAGGCP